MDAQKISKLRVRKALLFLLLLLIGGIVIYYVFNPKKALNLILPTVDEISFIHVDMSKDSIVTEAFIALQNKMPYKITIDTVYFNIELNNYKVAEETIPVGIALAYHEMDTIKIPINFPMERIKKLKNAPIVDSVDLSGEFYVIYNTFIGRQKLEYKKTKRIAAPKLPEIKVLNVKTGRLHLRDKTVEAIITLEVINRGQYVDMQLNDLNYKLKIKDILVSEGIYSKQISIKPKSKSVIDIPVVLEYDTPLKTAWKIITDNDKSEYKLNVRTDVKVNNQKKSTLIPVELDAVGIVELVK